jgi:hypothetical protein
MKWLSGEDAADLIPIRSRSGMWKQALGVPLKNNKKTNQKTKMVDNLSADKIK